MIDNILMIALGGFFVVTGLFFDDASWWLRNPKLQQMYEAQFGFRMAVGAVLILAGLFFLVTGQ